MTLYSTVKALETIALSQTNIKTTGENDLYALLNVPSVKYGAFCVTQNSHRSDESWDYYSFNLFYIDRLLDDNSNELQIQSYAKEALTNIILSFCDSYDADVDGDITWNPFTQRFVDNCAGQYCTLTFQISKDIVCPVL